MMERAELLESALECLTEGVALADPAGRVAFWNGAAERITGYPRSETLGCRVRERLDALVVGGSRHWIRQTEGGMALSHGSMVQVRHKLGSQIAVMARILNLRNGLGGRIGTGVVFHALENVDALPRGEFDEDGHSAESQAELSDRLAALHEDFLRSDIPFGVLWLLVDQAGELRRTHGARAVEAMLEKIQRTLANGLRAADEIGRWGENEFLVLSHERNAELLGARAELLGGVARTTDFRWWGDRITVTVSVGAAQAKQVESVALLLERAQAAMEDSARAGGNRVTKAQGNR